jgi:predicted Zn-dependent protease
MRSANRGAVPNHYRWVDGHPDYLGDLTDYRRYVLNHEVGHILGLGHVDCPGSGVPAPVMQQQSIGLNRCAPDPWPYPH